VTVEEHSLIGGLGAVPNSKPETIRSRICAKMLLLLIARKIASEQVSFPPVGPCAQVY
jgi:transketolase C-terminal domain/subunit